LNPITTDTSKSLKELGFTENSIVETIFVTINVDGTFNAAPMGILIHNAGLETRPFYTSKTYKNLNTQKKATINITNNPYLFLATAFKNEVEQQPRIRNMIIEGSEAVIRVEKIRKSKFSDLKASFLLKPLEIEIINQKPHVFSRGRAEAIEAVIHATRIKIFHKKDKREEVTKLLEKLDNCIKVINSVSGKDSTEMLVVERIKEMIEHWRIIQ